MSDKKKISWKKNFIITLSAVFAVLLVGVVAFYIWADSLLSAINRFNGNESTIDPALLGSYIDPTDTIPSSPPIEPIPTGKNVINIMLVGQDRRSVEERMHSDSMIMCTINKTTKTLTMTSFMRDTWVYIPDHYNARLNVPYMVGGFDLLNSTLEYNFGVKADYNVEIDFYGFMAAIDFIGGVDVELTKEEAEYLNDRGNWDVEPNQHWQLTEGVNHLTGSQALAFSRIRDIGDDFGRTNRQRTVLTTLIEQAKTLDSKQTYELIKVMLPMLTTDMSNAQILGLVIEVMPILSDLKIVSQRIPMDGRFHDAIKGGGEWVLELSKEDFEASKNLLASAMKEN